VGITKEIKPGDKVLKGWDKPVEMIFRRPGNGRGAWETKEGTLYIRALTQLPVVMQEMWNAELIWTGIKEGGVL
jgi:hypothetical protein